LDETPDTRLSLPLLLVLLAIVAGGTLDLVLDAPANWLSLHVIYEVGMIATALIMSVVMWRRWREAIRSAGRLQEALDSHRAEREVWRASAEQSLKGLSQAIDERLVAWGLTPTEREIAVLILKGESHKRIAGLTGRSERTVRQHAVTIYDKSGLRGRAELAAFFLQDLVLPSTGTPDN
jgi:DNA-binding CsgD family transcriptional regulator